MVALSWLDTGLVVWVLIHLLLGVPQGFLLGSLGLVGFAVAMAAVLFAAPTVAGFITPFWPWPPALLVVLLAAVLFILTRVGMGALTARLRLKLDKTHPNWKKTDRAFGIFPGAVWGVFSGMLIAWLFISFMGELPANSPVAKAFIDWGKKPVEAVGKRIPNTLPGVAILPDGWQLVPGAALNQPDVAPTQLEKEMLALVNAERKKHNLKPLIWDGRLAEVGRAHSRDMLKQDYFAHEDPKGRTVADRVAKAKVFYLVVGENLAFAPNLAIAHKGLMESPGHRANILRPGFGRAGIGIVRLPPGEDYVPVHKGNRPVMPLRGVGGYLLVTQVFKN